MTISSDLFTALVNNTAVGARVFPLTAPDQVIRPYITYQRIASNSENVLSGNAQLTNTRMQIDIYADTYAQALSIFQQIILIMATFKQSISINDRDIYEDATKLYRVLAEYSIWH